MKSDRRSNEPLTWSLFAAGGLLAAFVTPALLLATALLAPLGVLEDGLSFDRVRAFLDHPLGGLILWALIALPLWHAAHRLSHGLRDLQVGAPRLTSALCYGFAFVITLYSGYLVWFA
ncbi:fumarate reductase subunit FrdD [Thioalkalicoccus limnaeus]|uniref:Fumarate reductase subunit D n=1 Tax=Thioalkalicoccus limnaeus TaxID=120681 RepID=A0ABV4BH78_9GAMM